MRLALSRCASIARIKAGVVFNFNARSSILDVLPALTAFNNFSSISQPQCHSQVVYNDPENEGDEQHQRTAERHPTPRGTGSQRHLRDAGVRGRGGVEELRVLRQRGPRRARRAAVDPGGSDGGASSL